MEPQFDDELRQLKNALRQQAFRFILIGHNRYSLYKDIADWFRDTFPDRPPVELRLTDKDYRHINDELLAIQKGIVLIPDFGWLFREGNESICVAFNQRRDAFARLDMALICFIEPSEFVQVPKKVPDWWSLRSLELDFHRDAPDTTKEPINIEPASSSFGGRTRDEKQAEIKRLLRQTESTEIDNRVLLASLYAQLGKLYFELSSYTDAHVYFQRCLVIYQQIQDQQGEGRTLNNISQIYAARGDYAKALDYLSQSLVIRQETGDRQGEGTTLNNIGQIYAAQGDYAKALDYLSQSLVIRQETGDRRGEGATLNNIGQIYDAQSDYAKALDYLSQSLAIQQAIVDRQGEGTTLNNIGQIYAAQGDYAKALDYLSQSLVIRQETGDRRGEGATLNNIGQIYDAQSDYAKALDYLSQSLAIRQAIGDRQGIATTLTNMSIIYFEEYHDVEKAIRLLMQSYSLYEQIGLPDADSVRNDLEKIREQIGAEPFNEIVRSIEADSKPPAGQTTS